MADEIESQIPDTDSSGGGESQDQPSGGNPAWAEIQSELDPISFSRIESKLKEWDANVQQRLSSVTEKYKWADELSKSGYDPERIALSINAAQMLETQPEVIYQKLQEFLEANGRLPSKQELADEVADDSNEEVDPRLDALAQQQQQMQEFLIMQENQRMQAQADAELESEISQLRAKHPEFDDADMREVISRAALKAQMGQGVPTLEEAAQDYLSNVRNRILSAQRPGDSAPRLVPTNGGVPASGVAPGTMGSLSKKQTEDLLAELVRQDNARG